jgi:hypothetical protein
MAEKSYEQRKAELLVLRETYRRVFRSEDGKTVLADLESRFRYGRNLRPAEGQPLDALQAVWNDGAREPTRWITSMLRGDEDV